MKTKILLAGLCTSVAFVSCTNEDLLGVENTNNSQATDFALVFDGMNVPSSRMAYNNGNFKWQAYGMTNPNSDEIGVCRTIDGVNVVSNSKFYAIAASDDNTTDPTTWGVGEGKYAYFKTDVESIFEGNYVVTYPWNSEMTKDGKITATLSTTQKAEGSEEISGNDNYVSNYGFMMSEATSFTGGQTTGHFVLYPVLSRLKFNVTANGTAAGAKLQSVLLRSKDGSKTIPTELEIPANVEAASDGYLDFNMMTVKEDSKVSQIVLTMNGTNSLDATKAAEYYMTVLPGNYSNLEIVFVTDKGTYTYETKQNDVKLSTGRYAEINVNITNTVPNREYYVATATDWVNAVNNIKKVNPSDGTDVIINVLDNVKLTEKQLRTSGLQGNHSVVVNGTGKLIVSTANNTNSLTDIEFNIPVKFENNLISNAADDVVFNKGLEALGQLNLTPGGKYIVNGGIVSGVASVGGASSKISGVTFKNTVNVYTSVLNSDKTTTVAFDKCNFLSTVQDQTDGTIFTISDSNIDDQNAKTSLAKLLVAKSETKVILNGNVLAENVETNIFGNIFVEVNGNLNVTNSLNNIWGFVNVNKDAILTLGEKTTTIYNVAETDNRGILVEGQMVNNGTIVVETPVNDIDHNNNHKGLFVNNGLVKVAKDNTLYENQNIDFTNNGDLYITGISNAGEFKTAIAKANVTGIELTGSGFDFSTGLDNKTDFSNFDLVLNGGTITVPNGLKFADIINASNNTTIKGSKNASISIADLNVPTGKLTISKTDKETVTINAVNVNVDGELTNGDQVNYTGALTYTGTITGKPVKK